MAMCIDMGTNIPPRQAIVVCTILSELQQMSLAANPPTTKGECRQLRLCQVMVLAFFTHVYYMNFGCSLVVLRIEPLQT